MAGYRGAYRMFWRLDEDVLILSIPQPVGEFIPIGSGDSTSIAFVRPYEISPTVVLTGTAETLYSARAWLSSDELAYMQTDMGDEEKKTEHTWWTARIVNGEAVDHQQLDAPPFRHDNDPLQEHLSPWLPAVTVGDYVWSADGAWVVFGANQDEEDPWRIYAFHWDEGPLVGPFAKGFDLALAPVVPSAPPTAAEILAQGKELGFEVCGESTTWRRPPEQEQNERWWCSERYSSAGEKVVQYPWTHDLFVTYGHGSSTYDIVNLSGLWTLSTDVRARCLEPQRQDAVLSLQKAELWLLYHRVKQIKRIGSDYVIVIESSESGVQFVQFARPGQPVPLTLHFVTEGGQEIERIVEAESIYWPYPQLVPTAQP